MKISYAITFCNEVQELKKLLGFLVPLIREEDEIVVLQDVTKQVDPNDLDQILALLPEKQTSWNQDRFEGDFAEWKNKLNSLCTGDFIFQLDADEVPTENLIQDLPKILESNSVDLCWIPRANTVEGLTQEDIDRWHWKVTNNLVNWPDYQGRLYRNDPEIRWSGKVHERIVGHKTYGYFPERYFLHHDKTIEKQRSQNALYNQIQVNGK